MARRTGRGPLTLGVDIGGTKTAGGLVSAGGRLTSPLVVPTLAERGPEASLSQVLGLISRLVSAAGGKDRLLGIGICSPGPLNPKTGVVLNPPNLPGWRNVELARIVQERFGIPARVENDANAAGLAEVLFGAAKGLRDVFYVTVSTGIGTGIIIDGKIYHGRNGAAAEGGHVVVDHRSPYACGCGAHGCIEALASGPGMVRRARVLLQQEFYTPGALRTAFAADPAGVSPATIAECARRGDSIARAVLDETGFLLGVWLGSMASLLDPDAVVIGGGVARIGKVLFDKIRQTVPHYTINRDFAVSLPILAARLRDNVGVFGAASLFRQDGQHPAG